MLLFVVGCTASSGDPGRVLDPCVPVTVSAPAATAAQLASLDDALAAWRAHGIAALVRTADAGELAVEFEGGNPEEFGYYDGTAGTAYVNTSVVDPAQQTVVIAHELGHAFGLVHVASRDRASVMNPGNLTISPNDSDALAIAARCGTSDAR